MNLIIQSQSEILFEFDTKWIGIFSRIITFSNSNVINNNGIISATIWDLETLIIAPLSPLSTRPLAKQPIVLSLASDTTLLRNGPGSDFTGEINHREHVACPQLRLRLRLRT